MPKKTTVRERAKATLSSGNVFADIGLENPEELAAKAELVREINALLDQRELTQVEAARLLDLHQPEISLLRRGRLNHFSMERLFRCLALLNVGVELRLVRHPPSTAATPIRIVRRVSR